MDYKFIILIPGIISLIIVIRKASNVRSIYAVAFIFELISICLLGYSFGHYYEGVIIFSLPLLVYIGNTLKKEMINKVIPIILIVTVVCNGKFIIKQLDELGITRTISYDDINFMKECSILKDTNWKNEEVLVVTGMGNCVGSKYYSALKTTPDVKYFYTLPYDYEENPESIDVIAHATYSGKYGVLILYYLDFAKNQMWGVKKYDRYLRKYLEENYKLITSNNILPLEMWVKKE